VEKLEPNALESNPKDYASNHFEGSAKRQIAIQTENQPHLEPIVHDLEPKERLHVLAYDETRKHEKYIEC
jgi:hypothetical protein